MKYMCQYPIRITLISTMKKLSIKKLVNRVSIPYSDNSHFYELSYMWDNSLCYVSIPYSDNSHFYLKMLLIHSHGNVVSIPYSDNSHFYGIVFLKNIILL